MERAVTDFVADIKTAMDLNNNSSPLTEIGDIDTLTLDNIIESKIVEAVRRVHKESPIHLLEDPEDFSDKEITWGDMGSGKIILPDDFMRLVAFGMSDWKRDLYAPITPDNPLYEVQFSPWRGLRGTPDRPVCAQAVSANGMVLEFWSCRSKDATIRKALYMPFTEIKEGKIDVSEQCYTAAVYAAAALSFTAINESQRATALLEIAKAELTA